MNFSALNHWLDDLALSLSPAEMRMLMRVIAQGLRTRMRDRIKQQQNPDGTKFIPRKRDQIGNIRRTGAMFQRINAYIKTDYSKDHAAVGFSHSTAKIARIHQHGLTRRPSPISKPVAYAKRELVGFSDDDVSWIKTTILDFMSKK
ncbi:MAG: phage virion morphogenesis protein [Acinetobacter sp.]